MPPPKALEARPETIALDVLYEDDDLLVVDKPAGMVTHPAHGATHGTLVNALLAHAGDLPGESLRAGLVHRLDRDTSGLLVVAKREETLRALGVADAAPAAYGANISDSSAACRRTRAGRSKVRLAAIPETA